MDDTESQVLISTEQDLLGALLVKNDLFDTIDLTADMFFFNDHRTIFKHMLAMISNNEKVDIITLAERLEKHGLLEQIGGLKYLGELSSNSVAQFNPYGRVKSIKDSHGRRKLNGVLSSLKSAVDQKMDFDEIVEIAEKELFNLLEKQEESSCVDFKEAVIEAIEWDDSERKGIPTGLRDLDRMIDGFGQNDLVIIAARPSMGKSSMAFQIAEHVALKDQVIFFSLEMDKRQLATRSLRFHESRVGKSEAIKHLYSLKLRVDSKPAVTIQHIRKACRKIKREKGLGMIFVDYLQLMTGQGDNRNQEIGYLSRNLKTLAKEFNVPVIALSQLSRKVDERTDKRPILSDLRDSGEIEQDADMIIFIYRDEVYNTDSEHKGMAQILVRKNRNGACGEVTMRFNGELTRFTDYNGDRVVMDFRQKRRGFTVGAEI